MPPYSAVAYASLAQVREEIREKQPTVTDDDALLVRLARTATQMIDAETELTFAPRVETRYVNPAQSESGGDVVGWTLQLPHPLLEVTALTNGDGTTITSGDYTLLPKSGPPYNAIRLVPTALLWRADVYAQYRDAVAVSGVWSAGEKHLNGTWVASGETLASLSVNATSATLTDVSGMDALRRSPRLSIGNLLRLTSAAGSDYAVVIGISGSTAYLTRSERGSTALNHTGSTTIDVWYPPEDIQQACAILVDYLYQRRHRHGEMEVMRADGTGSRYSDALPKAAVAILARYKPQRGGGIRIRAV